MTPNATINVSVSSHYRDATYSSEIISQGILGESVAVIERGDIFSKIRQADDYTSWISSDQLFVGPAPAGKPLLGTSHFFRIHRDASSQSECIKDGIIGCNLVTAGEKDAWFKIILPDGNEGWAEKKHFGSFPPGTPSNILKCARDFLGYQYLWGGRSPKGFDCSGFVQTVFGLHGITIPRDSWQQQKEHLLSKDHRDAEPGDLLFFGRTPEKVTHVALSLGNSRFIHASGWVRYNSFRDTDSDFSQEHLKRFISVNRYPLCEDDL